MSTRLTLYEIAKIIGTRAEQLARGAPSTINHNLDSAEAIAREEFKQGRIPFIVNRHIGGRVVKIKTAEMSEFEEVKQADTKENNEEEVFSEDDDDEEGDKDDEEGDEGDEEDEDDYVEFDLDDDYDED